MLNVVSGEAKSKRQPVYDSEGSRLTFCAFGLLDHVLANGFILL